MKKSIGAKTTIYPNPALVIGSYNSHDEPNIMTASWTGITCSDPPCVSVSIRKSRQTYDNIMLHQAFTVNVPSEKNVKDVDYCGIYSGKDENKFEKLGLTPVQADDLNAPYIDEFPIVLICKLLNILDLGTHTQFTGVIVDVLADEEVLDEKNIPLFHLIKPIVYDYSGKYYYGMGAKLLKGYSSYKTAEIL